MKNGRHGAGIPLDVRTIKMALAAALCALLYAWLLPGRNPAFACIGVIFGMGETLEDSRLHGGNRLFGTIIGGMLGMALYRVYLFIRPEGGQSLWLVPFVFIGVVLLNLLCRALWRGGLHPGGVVLCILLFSTPTDTYVSYAVNRILDTAVGVLFAWGISFFLPRTWMQMIRHALEAHRHTHTHHYGKGRRHGR